MGIVKFLDICVWCMKGGYVIGVWVKDCVMSEKILFCFNVSKWGC